MFKKHTDRITDKKSAHVKFDNSNPYKATVNGERLRTENSCDVDALVNQLMKQHNNPKAQRYLSEIRQYITYEDEHTLTCWPSEKYLDEIFPKYSEEDVQLEIQLLHNINKMGCHVLFLADIDSLEGDEVKKITPLLMRYVGRFEDLSTNFALILNMGRKGNYQATDFLIEEFKKPNIYKKEITDEMTDYEKSTAWNTSRRWAVSNALLQIKDKSRLDDYIEFTKNADMRQDCCLIVELIAHFKCEKTYDCLIGLLNDENFELQAAALDGLRFFYKHDGIEEQVRPFLDSERDVLREYAKKVMKKIDKYKLKNEKENV